MKRNTLWTAIIVVLIIGLAAIPLTGFAQELAEPSAVDGGIDWYKLIVQVVVAVLGILLAVFANEIRAWIAKTFKIKLLREGAVLISTLALDWIRNYKAKNPEAHWAEIPDSLLTTFLEYLKALGVADSRDVARRALTSAAQQAENGEKSEQIRTKTKKG